MPQELRVLQCIQCQSYQVDIVKKAENWQCKICNTKQKLRKVFFQGNGSDCRNMVKTMNQERILRSEQKTNELLNLLSAAEDEDF